MKCIAAFLLTSLVAARVSAETIYGVSLFRELVSFDSAMPNSTTATPIIGLVGQDSFESVIAIDVRPATQQLYVLGNAPGSIYRVYALDPVTGAATQVGTDLNTITGSFFGFDFNPTADLLRLVSDSGQNLRLSPATGAVVGTDTSLSYSAGDQNTGTTPRIVASAYSDNVSGAATTTLYGVDSTLNVLAIQNPPNSGLLQTVGGLGVDASDLAGFDISGSSGVAYLSSADPGSQTSQLFTVNLTTGQASPVGEIGASLVLNDIAVIGVPEASTLLLLLCCAPALAYWHRGT